MMLDVPLEPARVWLGQNIFPDSQAPSRTTARRVGAFALVAVLMMAVQIIRIWASAPLNSI